MKIAKMSEEDLEEVKKLGKRNHIIQHLYWCYVTMFENACDPDSTAIEFKPEILRAIDAYEKPRPAIIFCPVCHMQHIDRPDPICGTLCTGTEMGNLCRRQVGHDGSCKSDPLPEEMPWTNPDHRSHTCRQDDGGCGEVFRLTDYPTIGVKSIETRGKHDTWAIHITSTGD